jgi:hypothetical protein
MLSVVPIWPVPYAAREEPATRTFDSSEYLKYTVEKEVGEPHEITRMPIFDNAPFLCLKPGDVLVKGKRWNDFGKGMEPAFEKRESYFVLSDKKYYWLEWVREENDKLLLTLGDSSLVFDWDVSLAHAKNLYDLDKANLGEAMTPKSFNRLKNALQKSFPETLRNTNKIHISAPHLEGRGRKARAVFQGLGFDRLRDTVFKYRYEVGNGIHVQYRENLIIGPPHIDRASFEGTKDYDGINAPPPYHPDPATAAKARAAYDRMITFQNIINRFLVKPRTDQGGFQ